ncbi:MAG: beta-galactosidase [Candidatus Lokiarchaeota archaeon]|nr:beta-galactosidase [Candidatus Lokiarchaeota archaeon]
MARNDGTPSASGDARWWTPAGQRLKTRWARCIDPAAPLSEYPRPQLARARWASLNGTWNYAITKRDALYPGTADGKILVPFPAESSLSGVMRRVGPESSLWYQRTFAIPEDWEGNGQRIMLNFGAVDWEATVFVNDHELGTHRGGFTPFAFDVTDHLAHDRDNSLAVRVRDPTNTGLIARGKQSLKPGGIFYTAVTGIWQPAWIEPVPEPRIDRLVIRPDIDTDTVSVRVLIARASGPVTGPTRNATVHVDVLDGKAIVSSATPDDATRDIVLPVPRARRWSPASPFLYGLRVRLGNEGDASDDVHSYFGMRKIELRPASTGGTRENQAPRILLNGEPVFQLGVLDQGYWPDGLFTAPADEALAFDIEAARSMGFNMLRKHAKVEPDRWYYHCDRLGMLVWQDMPSLLSFKHYGLEILHALVKKEYRVKGALLDATGTIDLRQAFLDELDHVVMALENHPSIVAWVPFNEGWGEECFDVRAVVDRLRNLDPTRLVDNASGWYDKGVGDVRDVHAYPGPGMADIETGRAAVNGEFGGLGFNVPGHTWHPRGGWGYRVMKSKSALESRYKALVEKLETLKQQGLVASVYTQLSDVEAEVNGLLTYDREVFKIDAPVLANLHRKCLD